MRIRPVFALVVLALCIEPIGRLSAQDGTELASARLQIQGAQLSIFQDGVVGVDDADQVLNVAEPGRVRTCYGGVNDACGTIQAGDPRVAGLVVRGELSGPELPTPRTIETVPGGSFHLPGFQVAGTYILQNIRLVEVETERVVGYSQPSFALLDVHQIVLTSASVSQLSLEDLRERGIELGRENFQAFNFIVGFAIDDQVVEFEMPILFEDGGMVEGLDSPTLAVDELPPDTIAIVERWIPPNIIPFALRLPNDRWVKPEAGGGGPLEFPLFGAIVMPGTVTFLNQFFDAQLVVANGAPADSGVQLSDLEATLALPSGHSLRLHGSVPATSPGLPVPVVDAGTQDPIIDAASQGVASWTLEGMEAGTHVVAMTVDGRILRPGRDPLPVTSRVQAAVDVVDPRFHFTFAHPDVVREGFEYSLFVTVANRSAATQNLITLNLREESITGAHKADPDDDFVRTIESIPPGGSETVEYALVADLTGEVVAATFVADGSVASGSFELYTGVGDLGIPLSPATLQLPRHSERLSQPWMSDDGFWVAFMRFLGLAYSLAVAPPSMTPDGLPTVVPDDVEAVAVDAGYAGQRTYLRDSNLRSLEVFILDLLGNREDRAGVDELRRVSDKGRAMGAALGELLRAEQAAEGLSAVDLWDHYLDTVSYTAPHVAAMVRPAGGLEAPVLEIRREVEGAMTYLAYPSDHPEALRSLPFGEVLAVSESAGGVPKVPMALVGRVGEEILDLRLHNTTSETASGRLTALVPSVSGLYREVDTGIVEMPAGAVWSLAVSAATPDSALVLKDAFSGAEIDLPVSISVRTVDLPPFRLIGTRRDLDPETQTTGTTFSRTEPPNRNRDLFGTSLSFLFNRPPDRASAEQHEHYALSHTFDGFDTEDEPVHLSGSINATTAFLQPSGRVVIVRYSQPLNPMRTVDDTGPLVVHTHQIQTAEIVDRWGTPLEPDVPEPEPSLGYDQVGSLLAGRVFRGNGEGVGGATIQLIRTCLEPPWFRLELAGETLTSADGEYFFEFAERDHPTYCITDTVTLRALIPAGDDPATEPATVEEVSTTLRRDGLLTRINIALLGRGSLSGRLVWADSGAPVEDGEVTAASAVFGGADSKEVAGDGSFSFGGVPVGPVTVAGRGPEGERVYATVEIRGPGDHQDVTLRLPRDEVPATGTVSARVFQRSGEDPDAPPDFVAGAEVAVYSRGDLVAIGETNPMGFFFAEQVPEGPITVQAALWEVSRSSAIADTILVAGTTAEVELTLVASETRSVSGRVLYHDPVSNTDVPIAGVPVFISGPGVSTFTDDQGRYRLDGVPTQGITDPGYLVESIDYSRGLSAAVHLPPIVDSSPDVVLAGDLVLKERRTAIRGLVLDPLANPAPGVAVEFVVAGYWYTTAVTGADGRFFVDDLPAKGEWSVVAHKGSGLVAPYVGWFDGIDVATFGGLTSFAPLSLRGSGTIQLTVRTESGPLEDAWVFVRRSLYMPTRFKIGVEDDYTQLETDPNGFLTFEAPVGPLEIVVYHPFFGRRDFLTSIGWHGQVRNIEAVFSDAGTVQGQVVDVDGVTPVPGAELLLVTETLLPQPLTADELGRFRYELVPEGIFSVEATATVGTIERHGQGWGVVGSGSTEFDLTVKLEPMGTVRGQVFGDDNGSLTPVPYARVRLVEGDFPWRTFPSEDGWSVSDAEGRFEFGGVSAGEFFVNARHPVDGNRGATVGGRIASDWEVVEIDDLVLSTSHGTIEILVRDPETGAPLADCPITLTDTNPYSDAFGGVTGADGRLEFIAMPLDDYAATAFHPPSGRTGRKDGLRLDEPLEHLSVVIEVDQRGEIRGVVWDDQAMTTPVALGLVQLDGTTQGGPLRAMASTSMDPATLGAYQFLGIPEGEFDLTATSPNTNRLGRAEVTLSESAPVADDVNLVLEPLGSVHVRLFERLSGSETELDPASGVFAVQLTLESQLSNRGTAYQFTQVAPTGPYPGHWYQFDEVLLDHEGTVTVQEMSGQRRTAVVTLEAEDLQAAQSPASPVSVVLHPMGVVRVTVIDENAQPIPGADVVLTPDRRETQPLRADDLGQATYTAVPGGPFTVTAQGGESGWGGRANGVIANDDDVLDFVIQLQAAHSIEGRIVEPSLGDAAALDPSTWVPVAGALVSLSHPVEQVMLTDDEGFFRFDALPGASYAVSATHPARDGRGSAEGSFSGPVTDLGAIVLDVDIPRLISVAPPNGMERVSRSARVDLTFSEPLAEQWLREDGTVDIGGFDITRADGSKPPGSWSWSLSAGGLPVVTFTPSQPYASDELYSVKVSRFVSDRSGRQLGADIGSSFRTADTEGPEVLGTVPDLARPFAEEHILRIDFNEALYAASDDPLVVAAAGAVEWLNDLGEWSELPLAAYFTREHYSFAIDPLWEGFELTGDTLVRRVTVRDLADHDDNTMTVWSSVFRMRDENAPSIDDLAMLPDPVGGAIDAGTPVVITPQISGVDAFTWIGGAIDPPLPQGDVDRVEYFFSEPLEGAPADVTVAAHPWSLEFVAAYVGDGVTPRQLNIWCRAVDTSTNISNVQRLDLEIHPNQTPEISSVVAEATAPVAGVFYAGSTVAATVQGLADADGAQLSLWAELRLDDGTFVDSVPVIAVERPISGVWAELPPPVLQLVLPLDVPEGAVFRVHVTAADSLGAEITVPSGDLTVADDTEPPQLSDLVARHVSTGETDTRFTIGEAFTLEARIADLQTAVAQARIVLDRTDIFPEPVSMTRVGVSDVYRSDELVVPVDGVTDAVTVTATFEADDHGGNTGVAAMPFEVAPEDDPEIPTVEWLTPWHGAPWPADHQSVVAPGDGVALALTVRVEDRTLDGETPVPGEIAVVEIRGPVVAAGGGVELAATPVTPTVVPGTASPGVGDFQTIWRIPDSLPAGTVLPFEVRAVDTGGHSVVRTIEMVAVESRHVYEAVNTAVVSDDDMTAPSGSADGTIFLLDGARLAVYPRDDDQAREISGLAVYAGGQPQTGAAFASVLSAPEVSSSASSVLFHPLNLRVTGTLAVGYGSSIDVSGDGLLGCDESGCVTLPGGSAAGDAAGGSHGGLGWFGSPNRGWDRSDLTQSAPSYGSLRAPMLPGGGGGAHGVFAGGRGGGVLRIDAEDAVVHLAGSLFANGRTGDAGGGAGGSIWINARELRGHGAIAALGASGADANRDGGGSGGRISVLVDGPADAEGIAARCTASGAGRGGAGTVYVETVVPGADASGMGLLRLTQSEAGAVTPLPAVVEASVAQVRPDDRVIVAGEAAHGDPSGSLLVVRSTGGVVAILPIARMQGATAIVVAAETAELQALADLLAGGDELTAHSREHLSSLAAEGPVRLVTDAELAIGPDAPVLDDRSALDLTDGARVRLRDEAPAFTITATPLPDTDVRVGSTVNATWSVSDPLGVWMVEHQWPFDGGPRFVPYAAAPVDVVDHSGDFPISATALPGPVVLESTYTTIDGRVVGSVLQWTVLDNAQPTITLALADGAPSAIPAGATTQLVAHAEDLEGLAAIRFVVSGPSSTPSRRFMVSGLVADQVFDVTALADADGTEPIVVTAEVEDISGAKVASASVSVDVIADTSEPVISINLAPVEAGDVYVSGQPVTITVSATDDTEVSDLSAVFDGVTRTSSGQTIQWDWIAPFVETATEFLIGAEGHDPSGNLGVAQRTITVEPSDNSNAPVVRYDCAADRRSVVVGFETAVAVTLTDDDDIDTYRVLIDGVPLGDPVTVQASSLSTNILWMPPGDAEAGTTYLMTVEATDFAGNVGAASTFLEVIAGDLLYESGTLVGSQTTGRDLILSSGTFTADGTIMPNSLRLISGATLTTPVGVPLTILADQVTVECSSAIDVSGKGYARNQTYPGEPLDPTNGGGSHMGVGGENEEQESTYGSVTRPQEMGAGGTYGFGDQFGGGVVRIDTGDLRIDGAIRADGVVHSFGGAGGSIWISVDGELSGSGQIQANGGGDNFHPSGGGGAVAIEYGSSSGSVIGNTVARGGLNPSSWYSGGAGTVYLYQRGVSIYGDLIVDNGTVDGRPTRLPALGSGVAATGSSGAVLETGFASIQPYFEGHWVEITDGATGTLRGTWRIAGIADGTVTLEANTEDGEPIVVEGDSWRGVYRFDAMTVAGTIPLRSDDPIRVAEQTITGVVETTHISAERLVVASGGTLTSPRGSSLVIDVSGEVVVEAGAAIDVSGKGYARNQTYPGEPLDPTNGGGSHMGVGGENEEQESTYGSVTRPQEMGAGGTYGFGDQFGGGVVRIDTGDLRIDGAIRADGVVHSFGGAGGSIWISVDGELSGSGQIQANGGGDNFHPSGGGGAVAIEYGSSSGSVIGNTVARGGLNPSSWYSGGAGTVYLYQRGVSIYGDLIVDNGTVDGRPTRLPALGSGVAATGSSGAVLETGFASIQPYFEGHWVEITDGATGTLRGTWRIAGIADGTVTLEANTEDGEPIVVEGDSWRGVYRFDAMTVAGTIPLRSDDPIRVAEQTITGVVETTHISAERLVVASGGTLTSPRGSSLVIDVSGEVVVEAGAAIDVSGKGYARNQTYPGEPLDPTNGGGSHMGVGGENEEQESTYGSVTRPQEMGAGGTYGFGDQFGGGVVRIDTGDLRIDGAIRADGVVHSFGGAGGSIWISVDGELSGSGQIQANGGGDNFHPSGGGGAVAIEYGSSSGSVIGNTVARGGLNPSSWYSGGAGTVYLYQHGASTYGDLIVDNGTVDGRPTRLPALGSGTAAAGSSGAVLETGLASIQPYFEGHWVEIIDGASRELRGTWRIAGIAGGTVTLEANTEDGAPVVVAGDSWRGIYRFDSLAVMGNAHLVVPEMERIAGDVTIEPGATAIFANRGGPIVNAGLVSMVAHDGSFWVTGAAGAVSDSDGVATASLRNLRTGDTVVLAVNPDGSFPTVTVAGISGDELVIDASDAHPWSESTSASVGILPANDGAPVLQAALIHVSVNDEATVQVAGAAGAVSDGEGPVQLSVENTTASGTVSTPALADGSFTITIAAAAFDRLSLTATDGHPEPQTATLDLGEVPDVTPPEVVAGVLGIAIHDQHYWLVSAAPAFVDDSGIASAAVFVDGDSAALQPLTLNADASVAESVVVGPEGGSLTIVVTDLGGNTIQAALPFGLPANNGPPSIDPSRAVVSPAIDRYDLDNEPEHPVASDLIVSSDGVSLAEWSIRSAPFATAVQAIAVDDGNFIDLEPVQIVGAVGDSLWLRVVDDHPFGQETEAEIRQLPEITSAPVVDLGRVVAQGIDGTYRVTGSSNSVIDDDGPISVTATVWRQTGVTWAIADEATVSVDSGAPFVAELTAALEGDSVILTVADSAAGGPFINRYRLGLLPAMTYAPTIDPAKFTLDLSGCTPRLVAEAGAVTAAEETISVEITVEHPDLGELEYNEPFDISSGQAFTADIAGIEPGSEVQVRASAQVATSVVVATAPTVPVVDLHELVLLRFQNGTTRLVIDVHDVSNRVNPVEVRFSNLHPDRLDTASVTMPCANGWREADVFAIPGDPLQAVFCNGDRAQLCTDPIDLGGAPIGRKIPFDLNGRGVDALLRRGWGAVVTLDDGRARWLRLDEAAFQGVEFSPQYGNVSDVYQPHNWGADLVDGPAVYLWNETDVRQNEVIPFGPGIAIDATMHRQNTLFVTGRDGVDLLMASVALEGRDGRAMCAPRSVATLESGTTVEALAMIQLDAARLGILVDGATSSGDGPPRVIPVDLSDPWHPKTSMDDTSTVLSPAPASAVVHATRQEGGLVLETENGEFLIYTYERPWTWQLRAAFGSRDGALPTAAVLWGNAAWVGYDDGRVVGYAMADGFNGAPPDVAALTHDGSSVTDLVTGYQSLYVGLDSGLVGYEFDAAAIQPELYASGVRTDGYAVSLEAGTTRFGKDGADVSAAGEGTDGGGDPAAVSVHLGSMGRRDWKTFTADLPTEVDGVTGISWDTLTITDRVSGFSDSIALADAVAGPPFLDNDCHSEVFSCGITTGAAGPGWRASGPDHRDPIWLRFRWTEGSGWNQHGFASNSEIRHLEAFDDTLLAASNELVVAEMDPLWGPHVAGRTPFGGAPLGPVAFAANGSLAVVSTATGLELAVVDIADPRNPWIVTAAQTVADGLGTVTDLHDDSEGSLWILTAGPDRIHRLDADQLPNLVILESLDLAPSGPPTALDTGRFDSANWGSDFAALFIVRRGVGLEMLDRHSLASGALDQVPVKGDARDLFVGDLDGGLRVLVAAGFDRGVVELSWDDNDAVWIESWLADLGHVRGFAYAADAFRAGEEFGETCQDLVNTDVKSAVSSDGTPRLYAITESGILHVDTDIQKATFGLAPITLDPAGVMLDQGGCQPTLIVPEGAIQAVAGPLVVTVHISGDDGRTWTSVPVSVPSGAAFSVPLGGVGPGNAIALEVLDSDPSGSNSVNQTVLVVPDAPPVVDLAAVSLQFEDGSAMVSVPASAISGRTSVISARLVNGTAASGVGLADPCDGPGQVAIGSVAAFTGDPILIEVCNVEPVPDGRTVCTELLLVGYAGEASALVTSSPITRLSRFGATVSVETEDDVTHFVSLADPWNPEVVPWSIPVGGSVVWGDSNAALIAGDGLERWVDPGVLDERFDPLGTGIAIQGAVWFGNYLMVAGAASDGIRITAVTVDRRTGQVVGEPPEWNVISDASGLDVLALFTLGDNHVGIVVDDPYNSVMVSKAVSLEVPWDEFGSWSQALPSFEGTPVAATVEGDGLAVWATDGTMSVYRLAYSGNVATFIGSISPADGVSPVSYSLQAGNHLVGFTDGAIREWMGGFWDEPRESVVAADAVLGITESHGVTIAASGNRLIVDALEPNESAEISHNAVRVSDGAFSIAPGGATGPEGGYVLEMWGDGYDAGGDPAYATWHPSDAITDLWQTMTFGIPDAIDGITDIDWHSGWVYGVVYSGAEYFDPTTDFATGVPFPDSTCTADDRTADADLMATGPGWRAWASSGTDTVFTRWTDGYRWFDGTIDVAAVNDLQSTPSGDLLIAGDRLWVVTWVDSSSPSVAEINPFNGRRVDAVVAVNDSVGVAAVFEGQLSAVRFDIDAAAVLAPGVVTVAESWGPVVDLATNGVDVWMATRDPNRILRLDGTDLSTQSWVDHTKVPIALTVAPMVHPNTFALFDAVLVLGLEFNGEMLAVFDGGDLSQGTLLHTNVGRAGDILTAECPDGQRFFTAGGFDSGLREIQIDLSDGGFVTVIPVGDHGDVRAVAFQQEPFREGARVGEGCDTTRNGSDAPLEDGQCDDTLFVLTEAGVLATDHQVCPCEEESTVTELTVDWELVNVDLSGCKPVLRALAGAVQAPGDVTIQIDVENDPEENDLEPWSAEPFVVFSGQAFALPLESVDAGSTVRLTATAEGVFPQSQIVEDIGWDRELVIDEDRVQFTTTPGGVRFEISFDAISWRLESLYVEAYGDTGWQSTDGSCPGAEDPYVLDLTVEPGEWVYLYACTGVDQDFCSDDISYQVPTKTLPGSSPASE